MNFLLSETFTDSLARLTGEEQKAVKTTAFDLQLNPANPGMSFHKLDKARDKNFWSVQESANFFYVVCYLVNHHLVNANSPSSEFLHDIQSNITT